MRLARSVLFSAVFLALHVSLAPPMSPQTTNRDTYVLSVLGSKWSLLIDLPGFTPERNLDASPRMLRSVTARNPATSVVVTATLFSPLNQMDSGRCRDLSIRTFFKSSELRGLRTFERAPFALAEFTAQPVQASDQPTSILTASLYDHGLCAYIQLSKPARNPASPADLDPFLSTVRFQKGAPPSSFELLLRGNAAHGDPSQLGDATRAYAAALAAEKKSPRLENPLWLTLVHHLALDYCLAGRPKEATATAQYGLSVDPSYPLFFYDLACAAARSKDPNAALTNLQKAFELKNNLPQGESMPDPRRDKPFARLWNDQSFQKQVEPLVAYMDHHEFPLPNQSWKLSVDLPGFHPLPRAAGSNDTHAFTNSDYAGQIRASLSLVPFAPPVTSEGCMQSLDLQKQQTPRVSVQPYQAGPFSMMEFNRTYPGYDSSEHVLLVCVPEQTAYLFLDLAKESGFNGRDRALFTQILNSIRLVPPPDPH